MRRRRLATWRSGTTVVIRHDRTGETVPHGGIEIAQAPRVHFDVLAKRGFPFFVCGLLATAAYFQARGIGALVGAEVRANPPASRAATAPPLVLDDPVADSILERNPFDSEAGAREEAAPRAVVIPEAPMAQNASEKCEVGYVTLITGSEDPSWSFAAVAPKTGDSRLVRIGDDFEGHRVVRIGWRRIWLEVGGERCVMKLGDRPEVKKPAPNRRTRKRPARSRAPVISAAMKSKIHRVSATEYRIDRAIVDEILEKQAQLMRNTRVRPMKNGDAIVGMRMSRIRRGTLLYELGLRNGDVIQSINGFDITNPQKALEAYGRLRTASSLEVQVQRGGKATTIDYQIQ